MINKPFINQTGIRYIDKILRARYNHKKHKWCVMEKNNTTSEKVLITLKQIIRAIDIHSKYLRKYYGLSGPQLIILRELSTIPEISIGHLAKEISLSQATVTDILNRLEDKEFIRKKRSDHDKRRVFIKITEKGKIAIGKNPSILNEEFIQKFNKLEDWEQTLILSSIQKIASMMKTEKLIKKDIQKKLKNIKNK
ncbi:MAG: MarR family transcriptional regulator [Candidatus Caldatribacteriota bacterium]|nr:MarR family transcriptional regulator [Candidatus Caldatribacteriota bacterium]